MSVAPESVFISYAHDNEEHKEIVLEYSNWLNNPGGFDCWIDRYMEDAVMPEGWPSWMRVKIHNSNHVLVVCSAKYTARYNQNKEEIDKGKGVKFESTLILNDFYQNGSLNYKFIPVILKPEDQPHIIDILQNQTFYDLSSDERKKALYRRLTNQPLHKKPTTSNSTITIIDPKAQNANDDKNQIPPNITSDFPKIEEYLSMKPGTKILQAFFLLPFHKRLQIAKEIGVYTEEDVPNPSNIDKLSTDFLERAYENNLLTELWNKLFDESIDPNPFKKIDK